MQEYKMVEGKFLNFQGKPLEFQMILEIGDAERQLKQGDQETAEIGTGNRGGIVVHHFIGDKAALVCPGKFGLCPGRGGFRCEEI